MEARNASLPIFYDVDPYKCSKPNGDFCEFYNKHERNFREDLAKAQHWRAALSKVGNIARWTSEDRQASPRSSIIQDVMFARIFSLIFTHRANKSTVHFMCALGLLGVVFVAIAAKRCCISFTWSRWKSVSGVSGLALVMNAPNQLATMNAHNQLATVNAQIQKSGCFRRYFNSARDKYRSLVYHPIQGL